jgi:hypothetical protein
MGKMVTINQFLLFFKIESLTYVGRHPLGRQEPFNFSFLLIYPFHSNTKLVYCILFYRKQKILHFSPWNSPILLVSMKTLTYLILISVTVDTYLQ